MALSPSTPTISPLPRQLRRYVPSQLLTALQRRPAPSITLPTAPRRVGVDAAASRGAAPSPKGRPGAPRPGSGGHVHHATAAPVMATSAGVVMRGPTPPAAGLPEAQGSGSGGKTYVAPATVTAAVGTGGPAPSAGLPAQGSEEKVDAAALVAASLAVRPPKRPGPPREGPGGGGGIHH